MSSGSSCITTIGVQKLHNEKVRPTVRLNKDTLESLLERILNMSGMFVLVCLKNGPRTQMHHLFIVSLAY